MKERATVTVRKVTRTVPERRLPRADRGTAQVQ